MLNKEGSHLTSQFGGVDFIRSDRNDIASPLMAICAEWMYCYRLTSLSPSKALSELMRATQFVQVAGEAKVK